MRKFLYSPKFGCGWVTWHGVGSKEERLFMLEYQPFIAAIERGDNPLNYWDDFVADWNEKFDPEDIPFEERLIDLKVGTVEDGDLIRLSEYDGSESYEVKGEDKDEWL